MVDKYIDETKSGVLGSGYAKGREQSKALKYRLWRRTREVYKSIDFYFGVPKNIIDLGTADAKMILELSKLYKKCNFVGVEYNHDLVEIANSLQIERCKIIEGDVNKVENLINDSFDIVIATAIIEHVDDTEKFMKVVSRILNYNGILVLTAPDPNWEFIATKLGHLQEEQHNEIPNLKRLKYLTENAGLKVEKLEKFMFSPIGFPYEEYIEMILRKMKLNFLLANQLLVARKI